MGIRQDGEGRAKALRASLRGEAPVCVADNCVESDFVVAAGETVSFTLTYAASHLAPPDPIDPQEAFAATKGNSEKAIDVRAGL